MRYLILPLLFCAAMISAAQSQISIPEEDRTVLLQKLSKERIPFYQDSVASYFSYRFGRGTLIATYINLPEGGIDTLEIESVSALFYGGRSDTLSGLVSADVQAKYWINPTADDTLFSETADGESDNVSVSLSTQQMGSFTFPFSSPTTHFDVDTLVIGLFYDAALDSVEAVSPVFTPDPELYDEQYLFRQQINDSTLNYVRQNHEQFWEHPENVGGMLAWVTVQQGNVLPTSIYAEDVQPSMPQNITITSYPNPFNPSTTINYEVPEAGGYELRILNVAGQIVYESRISAGVGQRYEFRWNATHQASGLYIIQITGQGYSQEHKAMLIK